MLTIKTLFIIPFVTKKLGFDYKILIMIMLTIKILFTINSPEK